MNWTTILVSVLSLIGGGSLVQLFRLRSERTKILAEANLADANSASLLSNAATNVIKQISDYGDKRIAELEAQINRLTSEYDKKIATLTEQNNELILENARLRQQRRQAHEDELEQ